MTRQIVDNLTLTGTLNVTGAVDLDTTLNVDGVTTLVGDVIASIIRKSNEASRLTLMGGTSDTQGPYIRLIGKDEGGAVDGIIAYVSTTESSAVGDHEFVIYDGSTFNLFAAIRAASWRYEFSAPGVAHGMTAIVPTSVYGAMYPTSPTAGGLSIIGLSDIDALALVLAGYGGGATPTVAPVLFYAAKKSGTGSQALAAGEPAFSWQNLSTVLATMLGDGKFGLGITPTTQLGIKAGTSTNDAAVGGTLYVSTAQVGNVGTGTDDLASYSVPANTLAVNGQSIEFKAWGTIANNGNAKTLMAVFGATTVISVAFATLAADEWVMTGTIVRTGAATQKICATTVTTSGTTFSTANVTTAAETLSGAIALKVQGIGVSNNDVVIEGIKIWYDDNNT